MWRRPGDNQSCSAQRLAKQREGRAPGRNCVSDLRLVISSQPFCGRERRADTNSRIYAAAAHWVPSQELCLSARTFPQESLNNVPGPSRAVIATRRGTPA